MATTSSAPSFFARHRGKFIIGIVLVVVGLVIYLFIHFKQPLMKRWDGWFSKKAVSLPVEPILPGRLPAQGKVLVVRGEYISPSVYTYTEPGYLHEWVTGELRVATNGLLITLIIQAAQQSAVGVRVDSTNITDILSVTAGAYSLTNLPPSVRATPLISPSVPGIKTNTAARSVRLPAVPPPLEAGEGKTMVRWVSRQVDPPIQPVRAEVSYSSVQPAAFTRPDEEPPRRLGWFHRNFGPSVVVVAPQYPYPYYSSVRMHAHAGGRFGGYHVPRPSGQVTYGQVTYMSTYPSSVGRQYAGYYYGPQGNKIPTQWPQ